MLLALNVLPEKQRDRLYARMMAAVKNGDFVPYDFLEYDFEQMIEEELADVECYLLLRRVAKRIKRHRAEGGGH